MRITFIPQDRADRLVLEKASGDRLRINGELFNFNPLPDGGTIPAGEVPCPLIVGSVERIDGEVRLTVILPHGSNPEPWQAFPDPIVVDDEGPIDIPTDTVREMERIEVEGGVKFVTTIRRWQQPAEVEEEFIPNPVAEEPADVEP